jgi:hypothetical protein
MVSASRKTHFNIAIGNGRTMTWGDGVPMTVAMAGWWCVTGAMVLLLRRDTVSSIKESYM